MLPVTSWLQQGRKRRASHVLIVCHDVHGDYFPVYVLQTEHLADAIARYSFDAVGDDYFIVQVIALEADWEHQLAPMHKLYRRA